VSEVIIVITAQSVKNQFRTLLDSANEKTGVSNINLTDAVDTLIAGYHIEKCPGGTHINSNLNNVSLVHNYSATLSPPVGFICNSSDVHITMGENNITQSSYSDNLVTVENITEDVTINVNRVRVENFDLWVGHHITTVDVYAGFALNDKYLFASSTKNVDNLSISGYYPIQIPDNATNMNIGVSDTMGHGLAVTNYGYFVVSYDADSQTWSRIGFGGGTSGSFSISEIGGKYIFINLLFSGSVPEDYDPSQITVTFR